MQFDLLSMGRSLDRIGTPDLSWWDLKVIIEHLPKESALGRHSNPDWAWDLKAHLAAATFDVLQGANWQRAGNPQAPRPKPVQRPGIGDEPSKAERKSSKIPLGRIKDELAKRRLKVVG